MKSFVVFAALAVLCFVSYADASADLIKAFAGTCKTAEKASDDDVDKLSKGETPETPEGKCLAACMGKQFGVIVNNKLDKTGFLSKVNMKIGNDQEKKDKAGKVADACVETTDDDRCEAAYNIWKCIEDESKAQGLELM